MTTVESTQDNAVAQDIAALRHARLYSRLCIS